MDVEPARCFNRPSIVVRGPAFGPLAPLMPWSTQFLHHHPALASAGWRTIDSGVDIKHTSHYQLANRLAFTWKFSTLGLPVVLIYLGFTGDGGIRDAGEPFADDADWQRAFRQYSEATVPASLFDRRLDMGVAPVWLLSGSKAVIEQSPPRVD